MMKSKIDLYKKIIREHTLCNHLFMLNTHKESYTYNPGEEIANINRELAKRPCRSKTMVRDGLLKAAGGNYAGAVIEYTNAIRMNRGLVSAWLYRAGAYCHLERPDEMDRDYQIAASLDPDNTKITFNRGVSHAHLWIFNCALEIYNELITMDPTASVYFFYRGWTKSMLNDHSGALDDYNRASELDPSVRIFHGGRGLSRLMTGDFKGALEDLEMDVLNTGQKDYVIFHRGVARLVNDDYRGAIDDFNRVILDEYWFPEARTLKGFALFQLDDFREALSAFQAKVKEAPGAPRAWFGKGMTQLALGDKRGYADLVKAGELGFDKAFEILKVV